MKSQLLKISSLFALFAVMITSSAFTNTHEAPPRWEKLGSRKVQHKLDRDEILVTGWEGRFTALRLKVEKSDINLHKVVVYYRKGKPTTLNVRQKVKAGTSSRVMDLPGNRRIINRVVFWYDTKGYEQKKGRVELWGRH